MPEEYEEKFVNSAEEISVEDLLAIASGADAEGRPYASAVITLLTVREDALQPLEGLADPGRGIAPGETLQFPAEDGVSLENSCSFRDAAFEFYCYGMTMVAEATFPAEAAFEIRRISQIIQEWMGNQEDEGYLKCHQLYVSIYPMALGGQIVLNFLDMVYATLFRDSRPNTWKMVMVFHADMDDGSVEFAEREDIDPEKLVEALNLELAREQMESRKEYAAVMEELRQAEDSNPYEEMIEEQYGNVTFDPMEDNRGRKLQEALEDDGDEDEEEEEETPGRNSWMRFTDDK